MSSQGGTCRWSPEKRAPQPAIFYAGDHERAFAAEKGSARLLEALFRYGSRHGLPNLSSDECRDKIGTVYVRPPPSPVPRQSVNRTVWTAEEDETVLRLRAEGKSHGMIAYRLGRRSPDAVSARLRFLMQNDGEGAR